MLHAGGSEFFLLAEEGVRTRTEAIAPELPGRAASESWDAPPRTRAYVIPEPEAITMRIHNDRGASAIAVLTLLASCSTERAGSRAPSPRSKPEPHEIACTSAGPLRVREPGGAAHADGAGSPCPPGSRAGERDAQTTHSREPQSGDAGP